MEKTFRTVWVNNGEKILVRPFEMIQGSPDFHFNNICLSYAYRCVEGLMNSVQQLRDLENRSKEPRYGYKKPFTMGELLESFFTIAGISQNEQDEILRNVTDRNQSWVNSLSAKDKVGLFYAVYEVNQWLFKELFDDIVSECNTEIFMEYSYDMIRSILREHGYKQSDFGNLSLRELREITIEAAKKNNDKKRKIATSLQEMNSRVNHFLSLHSKSFR